MAAKVAVKTRKVPDFSGVAGEIVTLDPELQFGQRKASPYDGLIDQLSEATDAAIAANKPLPGLRFGHIKAKASVAARAHRKGIRMTFAEKDGVLYARIAGRVDAIERRTEAVKKQLAIGPATTMMITSKLRSAGDETVDAQGIDAMLTRMQRLGEAVKQEGGTWKLIAKRAA